MNSKFKSILIALAGALALAGCESTRLHDQGMKEVDQGQYESGVAKLRVASGRSPDNVNFKADLLERQEAAVRKLVEAADKARTAGDLASAESAYRRVLAIEPGNDRATRGLASVAYDQRHAGQVKEAQAAFKANDVERADAIVRSVLAEDPGYAAAAALRSQIDQARGPVTTTPRLKTRDNRPVTLQFRDAPTKMVFEVLSRQTGINFIFDKDVRSDGKTTIFVQDVPIESAIDLVLSQNQLARQVMSENLVLIYPNTAAKQKDYQDQIVKTIYLNTASPKDVESLLKTVLDIKTIVVNERASALTLRETPEVVRMAEKLVASVDIAEPEVMLEVEVLEISRSNLTQLGIDYPTAFKLATPDKLVLGDFLKRDGSAINRGTISASSLAVTLNALKTTGNTNTLASPRIRARNKEKAKVLIGSRVPSITSAVTPTGLAGGGVVANQQVQYLDVGLTLDVEPTIYADNDVAIKVNLEVSSIVNTVKNPATGSQVYEIGTRNASTLLQLKDGETQILAGLIKDSDTQSAAKIPGLGDIPVVGRLFADHTHDKQKSEIVLSITPRIIRGRDRPANDTSEFWYGTESRAGMQPLGVAGRGAGGTATAVAPAPAAAASAPVNVSSGGGGTVSGGGGAAAGFVPSAPVAAPASGGLAAPTAKVAAITGVGEVPSARPTADGPAPKVSASISGPAQLKVGEEFTVTVQLQSDQPVTRARAQVRWDGATFSLVGGDPGPGVPEASGSKVIGRTGGAQLDFNGSADAPLGDGDLMVLKFKALQARPQTAIAGQVSVLSQSGAIVGSATPAPVSVAVAAGN